MDMNPKERSELTHFTRDEKAKLAHYKWGVTLESMGFSDRAKEELMVIKAAVNIGLIGGPNDGDTREQEVFNVQAHLIALKQRIENGEVVGDGPMRIPQKTQP